MAARHRKEGEKPSELLLRIDLVIRFLDLAMQVYRIL
jgi:hypothetical protein